MERKDIIFTRENDMYDLAIRGGDFVIGHSDLQHIAHALEACPSQYRQHPLTGCCLRKWLNGNITGTEKRTVSMQLRADGYKARDIRYTEGQLNIRL